MNVLNEAGAFTRFLRAKGRSEATIETYLKAVHQLEAYLGDKTEVTPEVIENFLIDARARMSPVTVAQRFRSLQQFFKWLADVADEPSPMAKMTPPHAPVVPPPVVKSADLARLLDSVKGREFDDLRDAAILSLFADTGIRRGEMAGIRIADMDMDEQVIVVTGKTGQRAVPYGGETNNRLERYLRARRKHPDADQPWLWIGRKGRFTVYGIEGVVVSRAKAVGLDINPHQLRHTFAHLWLEGGGNEGDLQKLAGWRSNQMLARYGASAASARARKAYLSGRSPVDQLKR